MLLQMAGAPATPAVVVNLFAAVFFALMLGSVLYLTYLSLATDAHSLDNDPRSSD